jgi:hypothetical protein
VESPEEADVAERRDWTDRTSRRADSQSATWPASHELFGYKDVYSSFDWRIVSVLIPRFGIVNDSRHILKALFKTTVVQHSLSLVNLR